MVVFLRLIFSIYGTYKTSSLQPFPREKEGPSFPAGALLFPRENGLSVSAPGSGPPGCSTRNIAKKGSLQVFARKLIQK
jgi:hypothetical protein